MNNEPLKITHPSFLLEKQQSLLVRHEREACSIARHNKNWILFSFPVNLCEFSNIKVFECVNKYREPRLWFPQSTGRWWMKYGLFITRFTRYTSHVCVFLHLLIHLVSFNAKFCKKFLRRWNYIKRRFIVLHSSLPR